MESKYVTFGIIILRSSEVLGQNMNDVTMKIHCMSMYIQGVLYEIHWKLMARVFEITSF